MLILGRYYLGKGAGATNLTWGIVTHNPVAALLIFILGELASLFGVRNGQEELVC